MKTLVLGFGQCGGRVADEFNQLSNRAKSRRGIEIVTGAFAVNTDTADLSGLYSIKADYKHRILIGGEKTVDIGNISANSTGKAKSIIIGFGMLTITVTVTCDEGVEATKNASAFVLLFLVLGVS